MSYKVIHYFTDLQDFNHAYKVGDEFPRLGLKVSDERIKELSSNKNKQRKPLIKLVEDIAEQKIEEISEPITDAGVQYTRTDINRMPVERLRKMAINTGVEGADTMTGKELKEYLLDVFNL